MRGLRRAVGIAGRAALCVSAIAGGAAVAAATTPPASRQTVVEGLAPVRVIDVVRETPRPVVVDAPAPTPAPAPEGDGLEIAMDLPTDAPAARSLANGMVMTGATRHRLILFTFDDGPDHRYTRTLLDALDRERVRAVFFLSARRFEGRFPRDRELAGIATEIAHRGHFVGNHTMDHLQLPLLLEPELEEQVSGAESVFERVIGERTYLVRPPGGARSPRIDAWLADREYTQMLWNLGTGDFQVRSADAVVTTFRNVLEREENERGVRGGIVLLHDIHEWSVQAFPRIVELLEDRNCELMARGEELYDFVDDPSLFFVPRDESSPSAEAPFVELAPDVLEARQARARARTEAHCSDVAMR